MGELMRNLPPSPILRAALDREALPWTARRDRMRYRGSTIGFTRQYILECAEHPAGLSAFGPVGERAARFFTSVADFNLIGWTAAGSLIKRVGDGGGGGNGIDNATSSLGVFGSYKHVLWLPGGEDWSSALGRLMATGGALYMPSDLASSHSLNTYMLLERCAQCVIGFRRVASDVQLEYAEVNEALRRTPPLAAVNSSVCVSLAEAYEAYAGQAEAFARSLRSFVRRELHSDCVMRYRGMLIERLPQTVIQSNDALGKLTNFSCDYQRRFAQWIDRAHPPKRSSATRSFDAWFDSSRGCALREGSAREASGV